ncbi:MAG: polysaccharide biosynthesis tyrosine autokinase [Alphaproteobacteria bacterium]|nr:polysaccharide biosynthesis tyrosine autokinase [Alphaproteobacteria bacterium]
MQGTTFESHAARDQAEISLNRVFGTVRRHKKLIAAIVCAITLLAAAAAAFLPPSYRADTVLVLGDAQPIAMAIGEAVKDLPLDRYTGRTQAAILTSRDLAEEVANTLGLDRHPLFTELPTHAARVEAFLDGLSVTTSDQSYVITLSYRSTDPEFAAAAADAVADAYIAGQRRFKTEAIRDAQAWLSTRADEAQQRATEADARYRRAELTVQLAQIDAASLPPELASPQLQDLQRQEAELNASIGALQTTYREGHQKMKLARAELRALHGKIEEEIATITAGLREELERLGGSDLTKIAGTSLASLESEAATRRELYQTLLTRLQELRVQETKAQTSDARIISRAGVQPDTRASQKFLLVGVAALFSFIIAVGVMLLMEFSLPGFHTGSQIEALLGVPVLTMLPEVHTEKKNAGNPLRFLKDAFYGEAIRTLRVKLDARRAQGKNPQVLLVTSSVPEEGKSSASLALALTCQSAGRSCLLVDCDLRQPQLAGTFKAENAKGLGGYLSGRDALEDVFHQEKSTGLHFVPAGTVPSHPLDLLESARMRAFIDAARKRFELVILDCPPLMSVVDAAVLSEHADLALYVVRWEKTERAVVQKGIEMLAQHGAGNRVVTLLSRVDVEKHALYRHADASYTYFRRYRQSDAA